MRKEICNCDSCGKEIELNPVIRVKEYIHLTIDYGSMTHQRKGFDICLECLEEKFKVDITKIHGNYKGDNDSLESRLLDIMEEIAQNVVDDTFNL